MAYSCGYPDTMNKKISPLKVIDPRDRSKKTVSNYNQGRNATRDTLRPKKGKYFKQGWGEDDRNPTGKNWIKKNKKYMKS